MRSAYGLLELVFHSEVAKMSGSCKKFELPSVFQSDSYTWGPSFPSKNPREVIPFAPFSKQDAVGKPVDWSIHSRDGSSGVLSRPQSYSDGSRGSRGVYGQANFAYKYEHDEGSFSLVDSKPKPKPRGYNSGFRGVRSRQFQQGMTDSNRSGGNASYPMKRQPRDQRNRHFARHWEKKIREVSASVKIKEDWKVIEEIELNVLNRQMARFNQKLAEDKVFAGRVKVYDSSFDRISAKSSVLLKKNEDLQIFQESTKDDPILSRLAENNEGQVFATDTILALLMASTKSVDSWDILVRKENGKIFLDKRPLSLIDLMTVNETSSQPPSSEDPNSANHPLKLSKEASLVNHNFSQFVLTGNQIRFGEDNPFLDPSEADSSSTGFRYRRLKFADNLNVICRCSVDAVSEPVDVNNLDASSVIALRALTQYESGYGSLDWKQKLDSQKGFILITEYKNNAFKMSRWISEALLSGASQLRLGFLKRQGNQEPLQHSILGVLKYRPSQLAEQVGIVEQNLWGSLRFMLDKLRALPDGNFLLFRVPNENLIRIYQIPAGAFDHEDEILSEAEPDK